MVYTWMSNAHKTKTHYRRKVCEVNEHADATILGVTGRGGGCWRAVVAKHNDVTCCQIHSGNDFGVGVEHECGVCVGAHGERRHARGLHGQRRRADGAGGNLI